MNQHWMLLGSAVFGITVLPLARAADHAESEPNDTKSTATVLALDCGDTITGMTTGSAATPGLASADYFRLHARPAAAAITRRRLALTSPISGHTPSLRGAAQSSAGAVLPGTDADLQFSSTSTTPPRYNEWYDFGGAGEVYYRVTGAAVTTAPYVATLSCEPVTPLVVSQPLAVGTITITTLGQGHSSNTDLWVYDANFSPLAGYGNDDEGPGGPSAGSELTRAFTAGTYYLALSNFNVANDQPSNMTDEDFKAGNIADFPGVAINANAVVGVPLNVAFQTAAQNVQVQASKSSPYEIIWIQFTVGATAEQGACCTASGCLLRTSAQCAALGGAFSGAGTVCTVNSCAGANCLSATIINSIPFMQSFDNDTTSASAPPADCNVPGSVEMQNAQWFRWTPASSVTAYLTVTPLGDLGYDGLVAVYAGSCANLVQVACGDEPQPIRVTFCATGGVTYFFQCGSYGPVETGGPTQILLEARAANGACCLPTGGCEFVSQFTCTLDGGAYGGDCSTCGAANCPTGGACCINGSCAQRTVAVCAAQHGTHSGVGTLCYNASGNPPLTFSTSPNLPIPDSEPVGVNSSITIGQSTPVVDLNVFVNVPNHTFISDLRISLTHNGQTRILWDRPCSNEHGLNVTFDDEGNNDNCEEPTVGPLKPSLFGDGLLELFEQQTITGTWTLNVSDNAVPDTGTLVSWGLVVTPGISVCTQACVHGDSNCNGSVNNFDIDPFVEALVNGASPTATPVYLAFGGTQECWALRACWGDINRDQAFNNFDIDPFVACIISLPPPGAECP